MSDVFISYSRADKQVAEKIAKLLKMRGVSVWFDAEVIAGASLTAQIHEHLVAAKAVIALWSKNSVASEWIRHEAHYALVAGKYIGVVSDEPAKPWALPSAFGEVQHIVFDPKSDGRTFFEILFAAIVRLGVKPESIKFHQEAAARSIPAKGFAFISHADEDLTCISAISNFLKQREYAYWTYHESDRDYQKPTHLEIEERLIASDLVLAILSPDWKRSEWTFRELWFAREIRKPLFLLRFRNPGPTLAVAGDTYIDFESKQEDGFRRLSVELDKRGL